MTTAGLERVIVLNAGSGSQRCTLFELPATLSREPIEDGWSSVRRRFVETDLATSGNSVRVFLIPSREAWQIARGCHPLSKIRRNPVGS